MARQQTLVFRTHGGKREGAGRKPRPGKKRVPHRVRTFAAMKPMHVTLRVVPEMGRLRRRHVWKAVQWAMVITVARPDFRICHVSIQGNHVHLIVEADTRDALARGMQGFQISCAKQLNARIVIAGVPRRGRVFADRFHARVLSSPTEVRNALRYVLCNRRHHGEDGRRHAGDRGGARLDPYATGLQFGGWTDSEPLLWLRGVELLPTAFPTTWLLSTGWKRAGGAISPWDCPGAEGE